MGVKVGMRGGVGAGVDGRWYCGVDALNDQDRRVRMLYVDVENRISVYAIKRTPFQ